MCRAHLGHRHHMHEFQFGSRFCRIASECQRAGHHAKIIIPGTLLLDGRQGKGHLARSQHSGLPAIGIGGIEDPAADGPAPRDRPGDGGRAECGDNRRFERLVMRRFVVEKRKPAPLRPCGVQGHPLECGRRRHREGYLRRSCRNEFTRVGFGAGGQCRQ